MKKKIALVILLVSSTFSFCVDYTTRANRFDGKVVFSTKVVDEDYKQIGKIVYSLLSTDCFIDNLFVEKQYRRKGIGRSLLREAMSTLKGCHCKKIHVEVKKERLITFYEKEGFIVRESNYDDDTLMVWQEVFEDSDFQA